MRKHCGKPGKSCGLMHLMENDETPLEDGMENKTLGEKDDTEDTDDIKNAFIRTASSSFQPRCQAW